MPGKATWAARPQGLSASRSVAGWLFGTIPWKGHRPTGCRRIRKTLPRLSPSRSKRGRRRAARQPEPFHPRLGRAENAVHLRPPGDEPLLRRTRGVAVAVITAVRQVSPPTRRRQTARLRQRRGWRLIPRRLLATVRRGRRGTPRSTTGRPRKHLVRSERPVLPRLKPPWRKPTSNHSPRCRSLRHS